MADDAADPAPGSRPGFLSHLRHFFSENKWVNGLMLVAIVIGFIQGWMKLKLRGAWVTFAFDVPVMLALLLTVASIRRGRRLFPDCNMGRLLIVLTALCGLYVVLPFGVPLPIAIASFRGWAIIPLVFLVGYHSTRTVRQMEVYLWLLTFLGVATTLYAIFFQSAQEIVEMMKNDPELTYRLQNQFYADSKGRGIFRSFSTFVSSAAFGGMMAYCTTFAVARLAHPGCRWPERIWLSGASVLMLYGVVLSGSRSSLIGVLFGVVTAAWYRRGKWAISLVPIVSLLLGGIIYFSVGTSALERFSTLMDLNVPVQRLRIVFEPALTSLLEYPFGGGLGRSGHGVPVILYKLVAETEIRTIDGDFGRIVVDMGILGVGLFVALVYVGLTDAYRWMSKLRGSPLGVVGLPAGSMFILAAMQLLYGSPFLGIPSGVLLWFFLGSMRRLVEDYDKLVEVVGQETADATPQFVSFISSNRVMPLFQQDARSRPQGSRLPTLTGRTAEPAQASASTTTQSPVARIRPLTARKEPPAPNPSTAGSSHLGTPKRFLFRRPADAPDRRRPRR